MKLVFTDDSGKETVYQNVTDLYIAVRQEVPMTRDGKMGFALQTTSHSWGAHVRELVKEVQQSLVELQDFLRSQRHGDSG